MGPNIKVEYVDKVIPQPRFVNKQIWNGTEFVHVKICRCAIPSLEQRQWLVATFGPAGHSRSGSYWDYSLAGAYAMMDEKIYTWFQMKWGKQ